MARAPMLRLPGPPRRAQWPRLRPQLLADVLAWMTNGTTTWPPPREVRSSQGIGGVSAGTGVPHFATNLSHRPACARPTVQAGSLGGPGVGGGSRCRCCETPLSRPRRPHRECAAAAATGPSSVALASVMPLVVDDRWLGGPSTGTPAARSRVSIRSLNADRTIRTLRNRSATVSGGGSASSPSSPSSLPVPTPMPTAPCTAISEDAPGPPAHAAPLLGAEPWDSPADCAACEPSNFLSTSLPCPSMPKPCGACW